MKESLKGNVEIEGSMKGHLIERDNDSVFYA